MLSHNYLASLPPSFPPRQIQKTEVQICNRKEDIALAEISTVCQTLSSTIPHFTPREITSLLKSPHRLKTAFEDGVRIMKEKQGYSLALQESKIPGVGRGVIVTDGSVGERHIVGLYPGGWMRRSGWEGEGFLSRAWGNIIIF